MTRLITLLALAATVIAPSAASAAPADTIELISRPSGLADLPAPQANDVEALAQSAVSADGCRIVFASGADGLAADDDDDVQNVFVRDRCAAGGPTTTLVSRADGPAGAPARLSSFRPVISRDGTVVAFESLATNLDPAANAFGRRHVFVRVLATHDTQLVSRATGANGAPGGADAENAALDADGSVVAFDTAAANLVPGDTNGRRDVLLRDRSSDTTMLVSRNADGAPANGDSTAPALDAAGATVAFTTAATDLGTADTNNHTDIAVRAVATGATVIASRADTPGDPLGDNFSMKPMLSADGTRVVFSSRAKNLPGASPSVDFQVWVRDLPTQTTIQASRGATSVNYTVSNGSISADGTKVAFATRAGNLGAGGPGSDVFVRDLAAQTTTLASRASGADGAVGTGDSGAPAISGDGAHVAFWTNNDELLDDDPDDFSAIAERDLAAPNATRLVSRPSGSGTLSGGTNAAEVESGAVSADGRYVVFTSASDALVESRHRQVFVRDTRTDTTTLVSATRAGAPGNRASYHAVISDDGDTVAYAGEATDIAPGNPNAYEHVFVATRGAGGTFTSVLVSRTDADAPLQYGGGEPAISGDGERVAFSAYDAAVPGDTDGQQDVYVRDLAAAATILASPGTSDYVRRPQIDGDGSRVAFNATDALVAGDTNGAWDVYVRDLDGAATLLASANAEGTAANDDAHDGVLSRDGRYVAFQSSATDLSDDTAGSGASHVFRKDLASGAVVLVSRPDGTGPLNASASAHSPSISADGARVAFAANGPGLDPGDNDGLSDVYLREIAGAETHLVSRAADGTKGAKESYDAALGAGGRCVAFRTASDLGDGHAGGDFAQVHLRAVGGECPDETAPTTTIGELEGGKIAFSSEDGATFECSLDRGAFARCSSPYDAGALAPGDHTLAVRATDAAGNVESPAKERAFSIAAPSPRPGDEDVTGGPGPQQTPDATPRRETVAPAQQTARASLAFAARKLKRLSRGRALGVPVRCVGARCVGTVTLKLGAKRIGRARFAIAPGATTIRVALGSVARRALSRSPGAKVSVTIVLDGGARVAGKLRTSRA